jgi:hypothetical protein
MLELKNVVRRGKQQKRGSLVRVHTVRVREQVVSINDTKVYVNNLLCLYYLDC